MATVELFFLFLPLLIFFLLHPTTTRASICPASSCFVDGLPVRFPFRLRNLQPPRCGYNRGFDLSCNNQTLQTTLTLPNSGVYFIVQHIDYESQTLYIDDPNHCLPKRFLDHTLKLKGTPFHIYSFSNYTFLNCSSQALEQQAISFPVMATSISCLSSKNHTVFAVPSIVYDDWLQSTSLAPSPSTSTSSGLLFCSVISSVLVPSITAYELQDRFGDVGGGLGLTWSTPDCRDCEARGGDCGFNRDANQTLCSDPKARKNALPRSAKYGIILGVGIPGLLCILGIASYVFGRIKVYGRRHQPSLDLSTSGPQQPTIVLAGLDGPTIESYPKTLLGESRRLPKPNDNMCSICLSEYQPKEQLRTIPECNHYFHASCIDEWLKRNGTCPVCRNSPGGSSLVTPSSSVSSSTFSSASP